MKLKLLKEKNSRAKMKKYFPGLSIFITLLAACAAPNTATLAPTPPAFTNPPLPTTAPQLTQTSEPTSTPDITNTPLATSTPGPTHTPVAGFPLDSCPNLKEAKVSSVGNLEIIYDYRSLHTQGGGEGGGDGPPSPGLYLEYNNLMLNTSFWLWNEDTQKTVSFPLPSDAAGPEISTDHHWLLFRRDIGEIKMELWVMDTNGQNEKKLATVSFDEIKAHHPDIWFATLEYGWIPHTNSIYYKVEVQPPGEEDSYPPPINDAFVLVDIHSGKAIQLAQPGKDPEIIFAPDGSQAAILTTSEPPQTDAANYGSHPAMLLNGGELRLINTNDGNVEFILPIQIKDNFLEYSPDGKYLIGLSYDGIIRMNAKDGTWQKIILNNIGTYGVLPKFTWVKNSTILIPIANQPNPDENFTIWRVSLDDPAAQPIQTFSGDTISIQISPDGNYLTFQKPGTKTRGGQPTILSLADLNTGNIVATFEASDSLFWSPNSDYYIYVQRREQEGETVNAHDDIQIYVSQIGKEPILLESISENILAYSYFFQGTWVDRDRFILDDDCKVKLISVGAAINEVTLIP
jgi:WD40 repeat protein